MKKREQISVTIDKETLKIFRCHCKDECKDCSKVIDMLIRRYLNENNKRGK